MGLILYFVLMQTQKSVCQAPPIMAKMAFLSDLIDSFCFSFAKPQYIILNL